MMAKPCMANTTAVHIPFVKASFVAKSTLVLEGSDTCLREKLKAA